jgi:hypothetical protein
MTDPLKPNALFRPAVMQCLVAIACLSCLSLFGVDAGLHLATASTLFAYCAMKDFRPASLQEEPA